MNDKRQIDWKSRILPGHDDLRETIISLTYATGGTIQKAADRMRVSYASLWHKMVEMGIPRRPAGKRRHRIDWAQLCRCPQESVASKLSEKYAQPGVNIRSLAAELGVSHYTILNKMKELDIERRPRSLPKALRNQQPLSITGR